MKCQTWWFGELCTGLCTGLCTLIELWERSREIRCCSALWRWTSTELHYTAFHRIFLLQSYGEIIPFWAFLCPALLPSSEEIFPIELFTALSCYKALQKSSPLCISMHYMAAKLWKIYILELFSTVVGCNALTFYCNVWLESSSKMYTTKLSTAFFAAKY